MRAVKRTDTMILGFVELVRVFRVEHLLAKFADVRAICWKMLRLEMHFHGALV